MDIQYKLLGGNPKLLDRFEGLVLFWLSNFWKEQVTAREAAKAMVEAAKSLTGQPQPLGEMMMLAEMVTLLIEQDEETKKIKGEKAVFAEGNGRSLICSITDLVDDYNSSRNGQKWRPHTHTPPH